MSDQVRGIVFVLLALLILFVWGHFYKPPVPPPQTNPTQTSAPTGLSGSQQVTAQTGSTGTASGSRSSGATAVAAGNSAAVEASEERTVVLQSPLYHLELSNRGAVVKT